MHVTGDRTAEHGLATIGYDDEGVAGAVLGPDLRRRADRLPAGPADGPAARPRPRSNGCAFADSPGHMPIQRMANVSLQPAPGGPSTAELIAGVEHGIYVVGDKSWSIDMQRYNFQFTGQRFFRIEHGRLAGQLRDVAYQATTTDFWNSMEAVGGPQTYVLAARSTAARASRARSRRSATAARRCSCGASGSSTPRRRQAHDRAVARRRLSSGRCRPRPRRRLRVDRRGDLVGQSALGR